jgi:hypothetical protein
MKPAMPGARVPLERVVAIRKDSGPKHVDLAFTLNNSAMP